MGKLLEKLQQVVQGGGGVGFLGMARQQAQAPRPAALLVTIEPGNRGGADAAVAQGADALIVAGWKPGTDVSGVAAAATGGKAIWGVEYAAEGKYVAGALKEAQERGAAFAILGPSVPAASLFEELDGFDYVAQVEVPKDDLALLLLRAENVLPVQAALLSTPISSADVTRMTVGEYARLRLISEVLRFPVLLPLAGAIESALVKPLVRLGVSGLVLPGVGVAAGTVGEQVKTLREDLERIPVRPEDRGGSVAIGGLMEASGSSLTRRPPERPEREPEEE